MYMVICSELSAVVFGERLPANYVAAMFVLEPNLIEPSTLNYLHGPSAGHVDFEVEAGLRVRAQVLHLMCASLRHQSRSEEVRP